MITPRASLQSVLEGRADVAPLDSYFHALLKRHEPETAGRLRVVARTQPTANPMLVASQEIDPRIVRRLGEAFEEARQDPALQTHLEALCLLGFARVPDPERYRILGEWDREAIAAGYLMPC
ncbi:PhnD/SsuA/transferrin family substrate-binding protein [Sinorhizobium arboris]|uniref:PhnD/SsuA/transferrin family substrate-binding protein n=1 Tax=Sinorhizobium arboris TaxID=76745 RepID=UPI0003FFD8A2|nr:PhnD/SsuA/transferrin family substrate-binding protein [Sinorhizobium arboris]